MSIQGFDTTRLFVRPVGRPMSLVPELETWLSAEVTVYLPPELIATETTDALTWLNRLIEGGDLYSIKTKTDLIGFLTLHSEGPQVLMIGYLFAQSAWGQGYASELLKGFVVTLQQQNWQGELLGGVDPANPASAAVLVKAGFVKSSGPNSVTDFYSRQINPPLR